MPEERVLCRFSRAVDVCDFVDGRMCVPPLARSLMTPRVAARWRALALGTLVALAACRQPAPFPADAVRAEIRRCSDALTSGAPAAIATDRLLSGALLPAFYARRNFEPAWSRDGELSADADALAATVGAAGDEGLRPGDYHVERIRSLVTAVRRPHAPEENLRARARLLGSLDALLTDSFLLYAAHLSRGKVDAEGGESRWSVAADHRGLPRLLSDALAAHTVAGSLQQLAPGHPYYLNLKRARRRLAADAAAGARRPARGTTEKMRVVELNMERWRWMPRDLGRSHVLVDVAAFELAVQDEGRASMRMRIVAGSEAWQTPDFSSQINQVVLNPYWNAPRHVLVTELIAYMRADPNYLAANKMTLLRRTGDGEEQVDPATIDFAKATEETIDFRLRQDPGPLNVLGRLMFRLPNKYDIYLHDTPYQEDFGKPARMYSHGCVRVEKPMDLALFLLRGEPGWTPERVRSTIEALEQRVVTLRRPVNAHVIYLTAWADGEGRVRTVNDVYQRDRRLEQALRAVPPRAGAAGAKGSQQ
jgi:murein L,D-transpeptidase YcbB/YkuD